MERLASNSASVWTIQYLAYKMLHTANNMLEAVKQTIIDAQICQFFHSMELLLQYIINSTIRNCFIFKTFKTQCAGSLHSHFYT